MRNLGRCILEILPVALHQPGCAQGIPIKRALRCVRELVVFDIMAQYRSHMSDMIFYREDYRDRFHELKGIFLEFGVTKRTQDKLDKEGKEIRPQRPLVIEPVGPSVLRRIQDDNRLEENDLCLDLVSGESHYNFIKMDLLSHFCDHIRQLGHIPMY